MIIFGHGALYEGYVKNNEMTGYGRYMSRNRQSYTGEFLDGKFHGFGVNQYIVPKNGNAPRKEAYSRCFWENDVGNG